jgi:hypothetical protein
LRKSLIPPPDPLIERQVIPLNKPKFGKSFQTINLEQFDYKDNSISENFILTKREKIQITEKEFIFDIYINSFKMLQKLVYYKEKFDNNKVTIENILNLREFENQKKKKKSKKNIEENNYDSSCAVFYCEQKGCNSKYRYNFVSNRFLEVSPHSSCFHNIKENPPFYYKQNIDLLNEKKHITDIQLVRIGK